MMFVQNHETTLAYEIDGKGTEALLLFHGFGQDHHSMRELADALSNRYTCYSIDLPFHGQSIWKLYDEPMRMEMWKEIVEKIIKENKIEKFSTLGFSIGIRFALATAMAFPQQANKVFLLAPDCLPTGFWYRLATGSRFARFLFASFIRHPGLLFGIIRIASAWRCIALPLSSFALKNMDTEEKRHRVYYSWVVFRHLKFKLKDLRTWITQHSVAIAVIAGDRDSVIPPEKVMAIRKRIPEIQVVILKAGHNSLIHQAARYLGENYF
jgi:pimeloyl-ACP methyl ester carboxylesterase